MWKTLAKSVQGISHRRANIPCQDSCIASICHVGGEEILILAVSDGAGSAERSDVGSRIACESTLRIVLEDLKQRDGMSTVSFEQATRWYNLVLSDLEKQAVMCGVPLRQLACTLLVAVIGEAGGAFCQLGDGAIVVKLANEFQHVFWPQSGEYANTTNFITAGRFHNELMFEWRAGCIAEIAVFTDGLQSVALDYARRQAHEPFFLPLFQAIKNQANPENLEAPMQSFLESPNLAERTDDDLTLILATRNSPDDAIF